MTPPRPIGTEFTHVFPACMTTTDDRPTRMTFRVIGHTEYIEVPGGPPRLGEELKAIKSEKLPAPTEIPLRAFNSCAHWHEWAKEYAESFMEASE